MAFSWVFLQQNSFISTNCLLKLVSFNCCVVSSFDKLYPLICDKFLLWLFNFIAFLNRNFNPRIRQFYVNIPSKFQYINRVFSPCYDLVYDINHVVITRKPVFEHIVIYLFQSSVIKLINQLNFVQLVNLD